MSDIVKQAVSLLADSQVVPAETTTECFDGILKGEVDPILISAFLMGLRVKGETVDDIEAAARVMRHHSHKVAAPSDVVDTCGTGGLPFKSLNTSTASAFVIAGAGGRVAKHGNRSVPPKTGSADVLEALGVKLDVNEAQFAKCVSEAHVGFMFARSHHSAMRHVAPIRQTLGLRTIFNILGPLTNPADAKYQVLGVFDEKWLGPMARVLQRLGTQKSWIVHGHDGLDEITITDKTTVVEVTPDNIKTFEIDPNEYGISKAELDDLKGGSPKENADAIIQLLNGKKSAFRDIVVLNAAAGLYVSGKVEDIETGIANASEAIDSGKAKNALEALITHSNSEI